MAKPFSKLFHHSNNTTANNKSLPSSTITDTSNKPLTVIELFQSQGCNSCPPTNANLLDLVAKAPELAPNILLLTYHVTYWDYLGWTDPFGQKAFDQRQRDYVNRMKLRSAFTPQVIVNGRSSGVGNTKGDLGSVMKQGGSGQEMPIKVSVASQDGDEVVVSVSGDLRSSSDRKLQVSLVTFDPAEVDVSIPRGENAGRTLPHINLVKDVKLLGQGLAAEEQVFVLRHSGPRRQQALLVQDGNGGPLVGAARV